MTEVDDFLAEAFLALDALVEHAAETTLGDSACSTPASDEMSFDPYAALALDAEIEAMRFFEGRCILPAGRGQDSGEGLFAAQAPDVAAGLRGSSHIPGVRGAGWRVGSFGAVLIRSSCSRLRGF